MWSDYSAHLGTNLVWGESSVDHCSHWNNCGRFEGNPVSAVTWEGSQSRPGKRQNGTYLLSYKFPCFASTTMKHLNFYLLTFVFILAISANCSIVALDPILLCLSGNFMSVKQKRKSSLLHSDFYNFKTLGEIDIFLTIVSCSYGVKTSDAHYMCRLLTAECHCTGWCEPKCNCAIRKNIKQVQHYSTIPIKLPSSRQAASTDTFGEKFPVK